MESMKWNGDAAKTYIKASSAKRVTAVAIYLVNEIKAAISEPSSHGATPSAPGEPPHKDSGRLRGSISYEVDEKAATARVGTNVEYAKFLELGSRHLAARPFLRSTLNRCRSTITAILKGSGA